MGRVERERKCIFDLGGCTSLGNLSGIDGEQGIFAAGLRDACTLKKKEETMQVLISLLAHQHSILRGYEDKEGSIVPLVVFLLAMHSYG